MSSELVSELLILEKWRDSSSLIKLAIETPAFSVALWIRVLSVSDEEVILGVDGGNFGTLSIRPSNAIFEYEEPREADEEVRAEAEATVVCALKVLLDGSTVAFLYEMVE